MKLKTLAEQNNYVCYWCKEKFALEDLSRDHIEPKKRGKVKPSGKCVLSCRFCNMKRGNKEFNYFHEYILKEKEIKQKEYKDNMKRMEELETRLLNKNNYGTN